MNGLGLLQNMFSRNSSMDNGRGFKFGAGDDVLVRMSSDFDLYCNVNIESLSSKDGVVNLIDLDGNKFEASSDNIFPSNFDVPEDSIAKNNSEAILRSHDYLCSIN